MGTCNAKTFIGMIWEIYLEGQIPLQGRIRSLHLAKYPRSFPDRNRPFALGDDGATIDGSLLWGQNPTANM